LCLKNLLFWNFQFSFSDFVDQIVWVFSINGASNGVSGSKEFSADTGQIFGHGSFSHGSGGRQDIVPGDVTVVFDVLDLLSVPWWFFQSFDDQRRSGWNDGNLSLSVLDGQFDGDFQAFPFFGVFADIVTDLFWGETEWSDFWGQSSGWGYFSSDGSEFDDHDGGWIEFWGHLRRIKTLLSVSSP